MRKLSLVLLLSLFLFNFSGCTFNESTDTQPLSTDPLTILNQQNYQRAVSFKDPELCTLISDEKLLKECGDVVDSLISSDEAIKNVDTSLCKKITLEDYEKSCLATVDSILNQKKIAIEKRETVENIYNAQQAQMESAVEKKDVTLCDDIKDASSQLGCRYNVTLSLITAKADAVLCDDIGDEVLEESCHRAVELNYQ